MWNFKISKNFAVDIMLFHKYRNFSDGITFFNYEINLDTYFSDHNPKFSIKLAVLNVYLFQFEIYNINHFDPTLCPGCGNKWNDVKCVQCGYSRHSC